MKKFKLLWSAVLTVFFVCCIQTNSRAADGCPLPPSVDIVPTLVNSLPGACEYRLTLESEFPLEPGIYCADWSYGGVPLASGTLGTSLIIECGTDPQELCVKLYCCQGDGESLLHCEPIEADCCSDPCEQLSNVTIDTSVDPTGNCAYLFKADLGSADPTLYCFEWTLNGAAIGNSQVVTSSFQCDDINEYEICVKVICCETGELAGGTCIRFTPDCACPCEPVGPVSISWTQSTDCTYTFTANFLGGATTGYCYSWLVNGVLVSSSPTYTRTFDCDDTNQYEVCVRITCCDTGQSVGSDCTDFRPDCVCPCEPIGPVAINATQVAGECAYTFTANFLGGAAADYCYIWTLNGLEVSTSAAYTATFNCDDTSEYEICVRVTCCETGEGLGSDCIRFTPDCACPCDPIGPVVINTTQTSVDCTYTFTASFLAGGTDTYCYSWSLNGVEVSTAAAYTATFDCNDMSQYEVCVKVICCETNETLNGTCIDFRPDCVCPCEPIGPVAINATQVAGECAYTFTANFLGGAAADYCYLWTLNGLEVSTSAAYTATFNCDDTSEYEICVRVICCETGEGLGGDCIRFTPDCACPCDPIGPVVINTTQISGECAYTFTASFLTGGTDTYCYSWSLNGVEVSTAAAYTATFDCNDMSQYEVCVKVICCETNETLNGTCIDFRPDCVCPCEPIGPVAINATQVAGECAYTFTANFLGGAAADYCYLWTLNGLEVSTSAAYTATFNCDDTSEYEICVRVICCETGEGLGGDCIRFTPDCACPCDPIGPVVINTTQISGECAYTFTASFLAGGTDTYCYSWSLNGSEVSTAASYTATFNCDDTSQYEVCVKVICCETNETLNGTCIDFRPDCACPCEPIGPVAINATQVSGECAYTFTANFLGGAAADYCYLWTLNGLEVSTSATYTATFDCADMSQYEICVRVICCETGEGLGGTCIGFTPDCTCPCDEVPTVDIVFGLESADDCIYTFKVDLGTLNPDDFCYAWTLNGVDIGNTPSVMYDFECDDMTQYEVCVKVICCETGESLNGTCIDFRTDCTCPCEPIGPVTINATQVAGECAYTFSASFLGTAADYCYSWTLNGLEVSTSAAYTATFNCDDTSEYEICVRVICCETGEGLGSDCIRFTPDCTCPCDEVPTVDIVFGLESADDCIYTFKVDLGTLNPDDFCYAWTLNGVDIGNTSSVMYDFECDDMTQYEVCVKVICCETGESLNGACIDFRTDCTCPCEPIGPVTINATQVAGECAYTFSASFLGTATNYCYSWTLNGLEVSTAATYTATFDCADMSQYEICVRVICCETGEGLGGTCIGFTPDCICDCDEVPTVDIVFGLESADDCIYTFKVDLGTLNPDDFCYAWTLNGTDIGNTPSVMYDFECDDMTQYEVCVKVICCETGESLNGTCIDFRTDCTCPCDPIGPVTINATQVAGECAYTFSASFLGTATDYCYSWTLNGLEVSTSATYTATFDCADMSQYEICVRVICCETGEGLGGTCIGFTPDCICDCDEVPTVDIVFGLESADDCIYTFKVDLGILNPDDFCYAWTLNGVDIGNTPSVMYDFECDDMTQYEVCVKVICCETGESLNGTCIDFRTDCTCPCDPIGPVTINATQVAGECAYTFSASFLGAAADYCYSWTLNGLEVSTSATYTATFDCNDMSQYEICVKVICCETNESLGGTCTGFTPDCTCDCEPIEGLTILSSVSSLDCTYTFTASFLTGGNASDYCYLWTLDGAPAGTTATITNSFHCNDDSQHQICVRVICCETGEGLDGECITFTPDCTCPCDDEINPGIEVSNDGCVYTFTPTNNGIPVVAGGDYCWDWSNPTTQNPDGSITIDFSGECLVFDLSVKMFCCEGNMGFGYVASISVPIRCCCDPNNLPEGVISVTELANCAYEVSINFPTGSITDGLCYGWSLDGQSIINSNSTSIIVDFDCTQNGIHEICVKYGCCEEEGEPKIVCSELVVDCGCTHPFTFGINVDQCRACFTPIYEGPCPTDCITYDYGDGTSGANPCHQYAAPGVYTVCMISCCCSNIDASGNVIDPTLCERICKPVTIEDECCKAPEDVIISISKDQNCLHFFDISTVSGPLGSEYCVLWSLDGGPYVDGNDGINHTHQFDCFDPINHEICARVFCCDNPQNSVVVCQPFEINCSCKLPSSVGFDYSITDSCDVRISTYWTDDYCGDLCYEVTVDGTVVGDENTSLIDLPGNGTYEVCFSAFCCNNSNNKRTHCETITVNCDPCDYECDITAFWQETVSGNTVTFTDFSIAGPGTTITGWNWNFGDTNTSTLQNPVHTYATAGTYTVTLVVDAVFEDGTECRDEFVWVVTTACDLECGVQARFDFDHIGQCHIQFIDLSMFSPGTTIIDWNWTFGDGNTSILQNPLHTYGASGSYLVTLTVTGWNGTTICTDTYEANVHVHCPVSLCEGTPYFKYKTKKCKARFYDYSTSPFPIINRTWDFGDGSLPVSGPSIVTHIFPGSGNYVVTLTITIDMGSHICQLSYQHVVTINCHIIIDDSASGAIGSNLIVYPNPTEGKVNIDVQGWDTEDEVSLQVMNVAGELIKTSKVDLTDGTVEVSLEELESGMYTILLQNQSEVLTSRVVKK